MPELYTFEGAVPHASSDLRAVGGVQSGLESLVQRQCVQDDGVVERAHETVHLHNGHHHGTTHRAAGEVYTKSGYSERRCVNLSRRRHLRNALFDALRQLSGTHKRKLFSVVTLLQFLSLG